MEISKELKAEIEKQCKKASEEMKELIENWPEGFELTGHLEKDVNAIRINKVKVQK